VSMYQVKHATLSSNKIDVDLAESCTALKALHPLEHCSGGPGTILLARIPCTTPDTYATRQVTGNCASSASSHNLARYSACTGCCRVHAHGAHRGHARIRRAPSLSQAPLSLWPPRVRRQLAAQVARAARGGGRRAWKPSTVPNSTAASAAAPCAARKARSSAATCALYGDSTATLPTSAPCACMRPGARARPLHEVCGRVRVRVETLLMSSRPLPHPSHEAWQRPGARAAGVFSPPA